MQTEGRKTGVRPVVGRNARIRRAGLLAVALLAGCSSVSLNPPTSAVEPGLERARAVQASLPEGMRVPDTHRLALQVVAIGRVGYECRADAGGGGRWQAVSVEATLKDGAGRSLGQMSGPPATWSLSRGGRVTATRTLAEFPRAPALPLQLLEVETAGAEPAGAASGAEPSVFGVDRVQQVSTRAGLPRTVECQTADSGRRDNLPFQADYHFWRPATAVAPPARR